MKAITNNFSLAFAKQLDALDELAPLRDEFYVREDMIYLDGNSLGLISKRAERTMLELLESWKTHHIDGWTQGERPWFYLPETLSKQMAALVGADPEEVIITGSTSSNIHQLVSTFYQPQGKRTKIMATELDFPTDIYALQSQLRLKGFDPDQHLIRVTSRDGRMIEEDDIIAAMSDEVALILLPTVLYRSGQLLDMQRLTTEAHARGILIGFDGCHSVGSIPHYLSDWEVDFALWCNYKYVNGGPGGVASLYVNKKHFGRIPGLTGWYSSNKDKQFDMEHSLTVEQTAGAYQIGTPHIFSIAPLIGSLEIFEMTTIEQIRQKSLHISRYMIDLINHELQGLGYTIANPMDDARRGGHISLEHDEAIRICKALKQNQVIPDYRSPNVVRLAPVALYTTYEDVWKTVQILKLIIVEKQYEAFDTQRGVVA
ncbi:kynureninase [Paenibacillus sp. J23TS9]|uniref:kynureninase n=1 Tax=Paenibacillus sp. J23TS9 TaxID=2807193 RepID=UPI001B27A587|nr:kynureninase [Paenibacillus sp. J23TS9]GIP29351.1 kynureninase [Paenibacillus sp. J23TS9]